MAASVKNHPRTAPLPRSSSSRRERSVCAGCPSAAALLLLAGLALIAGCGGAKKGPPQMPPPQVTTTAVVTRNVPIYGEWVANLDGFTNAQIQPQVTGYLVRQDYKEGSVVHKGQVLFDIDPRPFQALVDQAKGQLSQAQAQLQLAQINVKRDTPLSDAHAIARSQLDNDLQTQSANAATVKAMQANVEAANLNLGFTKVRSLLDGIAGIATTQVGALVNTTTVLTTVSQVQPIKVYFAISEQEYLALSKKAEAAGSADLLHGASNIPIQLTLSNGTVYPHPGRIIFVDRAVDTQTGTIRVAASFPNPENLLRPGQYGKVRAQTQVHENALLVPQRSVTELQGSFEVAVVNSDNKVHLQPVEVGPQLGTEWLINSGLKAGEQVVVEGTGKMAEGMPVKPKQDNGANQPNVSMGATTQGDAPSEGK